MSSSERTKVFTLCRVEFVPKLLERGRLYVSEEFAVAVHLCACGCESRVVTPLGPTEWAFRDEHGKPTLKPSIGSWQLPCRSHYFITAGNVHWSTVWSSEQIESGRREEEQRRRAYYASQRRPTSLFDRVRRWLKTWL